MPTPGFNPDSFPDMRIPERTDPVPAPRPMPDMTIPDRLPEPVLPQSGSGQSWKVGDRVLAPWEPNFLYTGRIADIQDNQALIQFGDGDEGWVVLERLRPLVVPKGQKVLSRRNMGPNFFPGEILEVRGDEVCVGFDDGGEDEWTTIAALRIPCQPGPGATPTKVAAPLPHYQGLQPPHDQTFQTGDRVWAPWNSATLFAGTVDQIKDDGEVHIHFDDGDRGWVLREQLLPLDIPVGMQLAARKRRGGQYFPATVHEVQGERICLIFEDDKTHEHWAAPADLVLLTQPYGPDARPTRNVASGPNMSWLIYFCIAILFAILRAGCR